ncbi:MAG: ABC transporter permease [Mycoplasmoidaceae bacterium]
MNKFISIFKKNSFKILLPYFVLSFIFIIVPLLIIVIKSFAPIKDGSSNNIANNFNWIGDFIWKKIIFTVGIATVSTLIVLIIGFPFSYFLSRSKSLMFRSISLILISSPIWLSLLIKIIGIKLLMDSTNGYLNSTFGDIYTIMTLVYLNLPIFILAAYNVVDLLPNNLINSSKDLGKNNVQTFFLVVVPFAKQGIIAGLFLTFVTCFGATGITSFVNLSNSSALIGDIIFQLGQNGLSNNVALGKISGLCLIISLIIFAGYLFLYFLPKNLLSWISKRKNHSWNGFKNDKL